MLASADLGPSDRNEGCSHSIRCFNMGCAKRPRQLLSASLTTTFPSPQGYGVHMAHQITRLIHGTKERDLAMVSCTFPTQVFRISSFYLSY